jgi:hypothetical protein
MMFSIPHVLSCLTLAIAAVYRRCTHPSSNGAHRFLFPYVMAAGCLGVVWLMPYFWEVAMQCYSTRSHEPLSFRFTGPYAWVYLSAIFLPILPGIAILPGIGKRPVLVAIIALLAILPASFSLFF